MGVPHYDYQHYLLRSIAAQLHLPETIQIASQPGIQSVYRITCHYPDEQRYDSVATLISTATRSPTLNRINIGASDQVDDILLEKEHVLSFARELSKIKFDRLVDQTGIPTRNTTLWLVERAAGSFCKKVLVAPDIAEATHQTLVCHIRTYLPRAIDEIGI